MNLTEATMQALQNKLIEGKTIGNVIYDYITINGGYTESQYESNIYGFIFFRQKLDKQLIAEIKEYMKNNDYKDIDELYKLINKRFGPVDYINLGTENYNPHNPINFNIKW